MTRPRLLIAAAPVAALAAATAAHAVISSPAPAGRLAATVMHTGEPQLTVTQAVCRPRAGADTPAVTLAASTFDRLAAQASGGVASGRWRECVFTDKHGTQLGVVHDPRNSRETRIIERNRP